jgi:hypothetical protein
MREANKSFVREIFDVLEAAGFEVIGITGPEYEVVCDWAKVTIRRLPPNMPEDAHTVMAGGPYRPDYSR